MSKLMVIAGATGLIGAAAVDIAIARGWRVIALVRSPAKLKPRDGLDAWAADFDDLGALAERLKALAPKAFLCTLGTTIKIAGSQEAFAKVDLDAALDPQQFVGAAGYEHVEIAQPSFLVGERAEQRAGEGMATAVSQALAPLLLGPLAKYRPISGVDVARALVAGLEQPQRGVFVRRYADLRTMAQA